MHRRLFFILMVVISCHATLAQITPIGLVPAYYNGGFAGEAGVPRISAVSYFSSYEGYPGTYTSYSNYVSFDNFFKKIRSGISITAGQETSHSDYDSPEPSPRSERYLATIGISPKFSVKGKYTIAPFVDFSLVHSARHAYHYYYNPQSYQYYYEQFTSVLTRAGLLVNSRKAYAGVTIEVSEEKISETQTLNVPGYPFEATFRAILQTGFTLQRLPDSKFSFTPQIAISYYRGPGWGGIDFNDISLIGRYKRFIGGLNMAGVVTGYQNEKFKIMLSQWPFSLGRGYTGSIGVRYKFKSASNSTVPFK